MNKSSKQTKSIPLIHIVIRIRKTKKNRNTMAKRKKYKRTNNNLQKKSLKITKG
jgi:hypothetical protein